MEAQAFGDQRQTDHQEEAQAQHDDGRMRVDEARERLGGKQHDAHRDHDGGHHDAKLVDHADGSDHGVEREHGVEHDDLRDDGGKAGVGALAGGNVQLAFDTLVQLHRRLGQQEEAAHQQNQVAPGERQRAEGNQGCGEFDEPGDDGEQAKTHDHGERQADKAGFVTLVRGEFVRQDGDEDQVVDAKDDLEHDKGEQADPDIWVKKPFH